LHVGLFATSTYNQQMKKKPSSPDDAARLQKGKPRALVAKGNMVKAIRAKLKMSQPEFTEAFKLSPLALLRLERDYNELHQSERTLLRVIEHEPAAVRRALGSSNTF
jgi:DNA-binding transcriptional regulator YiaG